MNQLFLSKHYRLKSMLNQLSPRIIILKTEREQTSKTAEGVVGESGSQRHFNVLCDKSMFVTVSMLSNVSYLDLK
jgi:hypothetical protein